MAAMHKVQTLDGWWKRLLAAIAVFMLRIYWATVRVSISSETEEMLLSVGENTIFALWHENLVASNALKELLPKSISLYGLISPSKDGAWLAAIFDGLGIGAIRGSSMRNGALAISESVAALRNGASLALTPDGPRGPAHKFKRGAAAIAKATGSTIVLVSVSYGRCLRLHSWDRLKIPFPFTGVSVHTKTFHYADFADLGVDTLTAALEKALDDLPAEDPP